MASNQGTNQHLNQGIYSTEGLKQASKRLRGLLGRVVRDIKAGNVDLDYVVNAIKYAIEENEFTLVQGLWLYHDKFNVLSPIPPVNAIKGINRITEMGVLKVQLEGILDVVEAYCAGIGIKVNRQRKGTIVEQVISDASKILHFTAKLIDATQ